MFGSALLCTALFALTESRAGQSEDPEARWRREYPRAAAELERAAQHFLARGTYYVHSMVGKETVTNELTVASSGDKKLYIRDKNTIQSPPRKKSGSPGDKKLNADKNESNPRRRSGPAHPRYSVGLRITRSN